MPDPRAPETASPVPSFDLADVGRARTLVERRLAAAGIASPAAEALVLLEAATGLDRRVVLLQPDRPLDAAARARLAHLLHRRVAREPLQHVIGTAPFYGLDLVVSPAVLVPRPETERLVERVLAELPPSPDGLVLDVGCGSGAIALALKAERAALEVWGSDVSAEALAVARENGRRLGLEVTWRRSDLLADADVAAAAARCLALVSNPPYLPESDLAHLPPEVRADSELALFAGEDGLAVARRLVLQAERLLPPGALFALELDPRNVERLARRLRGWHDVRLERDLTGRTRFLLARR